MSYVQLVRGNDWGVEYFARPGKQVDERGMADARKLALQFEDGASVRVRWPTGEESVERIDHETRSNEVFDHGNSYTVRFRLAGITKVTHGIPHWIPLDRVKVHDGDIPRAGHQVSDERSGK